VEVAGGWHRDDGHAFLINLWRIKLNLIRDDDDGRILAAVRIETECSSAARDHEADVTITKLVAAAGFDHCVHDRLVSHGNAQQECFGGVKQPIDVLLQLENTAMIRSDAFEDAIAVQQAVIEDGYLRVALAIIFAVNVNFHGSSVGPKLRDDMGQSNVESLKR